jgi:hypothetical protein
MAAVAPYGLRPVGTLSGAPWQASVKQYLIPSGNGTAVFVGDMVKTDGSTGAANTIVNGIDCSGMPTAIQGNHATATADVVGVVVGFLPDPANLSTRYRLASTNRIALVCTAPDAIYEIQEDGVGGTCLAANAGGGMATLTADTGNTTTGVSKNSIDSSVAITTTQTLPVKVIGLSRKPGARVGTSATDVASWEVVINSSAWLLRPAGLAA